MMSIIRIKKGREYVSIANAILQNKILSWEARGIMAYLLSKPDGWECRNYDLVNQGPAGKHIIHRVLKELQAAGYIYRYQKSDGHKIEWVTEIYETPELNTTSRNTDIPQAEKPPDGNSAGRESGDIVSTDSQKVLIAENTEMPQSGDNGSTNTEKQPTSPEPDTNHILTEQQADELLIFGKHPDSDAANPSFDIIQEIRNAGWQIRNHIVEQAIAYYLEAVRQHHTAFAVPNDKSIRKDWYKAIDGHLQDYRIDDLKIIYPAAIERLKEWGMIFSRPGSLTKSLPDVAMKTQTGDVVAWL